MSELELNIVEDEGLKEGVSPELKEKKFRIQNQKLMLTYKTHIHKKMLIKWIIDKTKKKVRFIRAAHETGLEDPEHPYEHTHLLIDFGSIFQTTDVRYFDLGEIHPNIKKIKTTKHFEHCKMYLAKEDKENEDLKKTSLYYKISQCETLTDALAAHAKSPGDALGVITLFNTKESVPIKQTYKPDLQWQQELIKEVDKTPDFRKIIWYVDLIGNSGKTQLARHLYIKDNTKWLISKDAGTSRDFATIISSAISNGWNHHGFILDLPRQCSGHSRMYQYIEEAKDGFVTAQKYQGKTVIFNQPHVIVFSNWWPSIHNLSLDRWDIREIMPDKTARHLTLEEVKQKCELPSSLNIIE